MSKSSFLINADVWQTLPSMVKSAKHIDAAIAYFGKDGAKLLPLKRGDYLVVDMSPATVKAGSTNPYEIEKLIKRGVKVFSRQNLHAKIVIADKRVLVGSANVSKHSRDVLDEAVLLTDDPIALKRAKEFVTRICTEPVLPKYLAECKRIYKPPRIGGRNTATGKRASRASPAKLWLVSLVDYFSIPDSEIEAFKASEDKARGLLKKHQQTQLTTFHWYYKPKMADELKKGDWIIECVKHEDKSITVYPPAQLLKIDHYRRNPVGKERYLFHLEAFKRREKMSWAKFRKLLNSIVDKKILKPRTMAIRKIEQADKLLRLWTPKGRVSRR